MMSTLRWTGYSALNTTLTPNIDSWRHFAITSSTTGFPCISNIQYAIRNLVGAPVHSSREKLEQAHRAYSQISDGPLISLSAEKWEADKVIESVPLLLEWDDICITLQRRNIHL